MHPLAQVLHGGWRAALIALVALLATAPAIACEGAATICFERSANAFPLIEEGRPAPIYADDRDFPGVLRAARNFQTDLGALAGAAPPLQLSRSPGAGTVIIIGTLGRSALIDRLVRQGKLDARGVAGTWEGFVQQVVDRPMRGVERALVIAGADKRGTIFGVYDLAERMGVSPWSWWADVPVRRRSDLYVTAGRRAEAPLVRYRGIFLNDENPALYGWANETFGGFNHRFYERVFELILRLKGNYLWPAMWGKAIYDDDPQSPELADEMGVVIGTSHHEPMMRAHVEWERYGEGTPWDYTRNEERLRAFWRRGIERMGDNESIVTLGMRGDGDEPMTQGTAIALLERIVRDQRQILSEVTRRPASETPQIWALYKEVQDYYDEGMQVPDEVTLLFSDDNWGNIRRLPDLGRTRPGGYGIYYHFDYVGGPRNYKWLNTNQIERVWEQMRLAHEYGADRIWIVNVGDLKPMEFPIDFFLDYAWNPPACPLECLRDYPRAWAARQFGDQHAGEIGELLTRYTQYNARRKPELISPETFSLVHFREAERVLSDWNALLSRAQRVNDSLPAESRDAYFQLVLHPIMASANLNELYVAAGRNRLYAQQGRATANLQAERVRELFARDAEITRMYHELNGGKWRHMMSQTHIGYTSWQQPPENVVPETQTIDVPAGALMGVAIEGDGRAWPAARGEAVLPQLSPFTAPSRYIDVFNRGQSPFRFTATTRTAWVRVSQTSGQIRDEVRLDVSVDWSKAPPGAHRAPIVLRRVGGRETVTVIANVFNPTVANVERGFVEANGYAAMEAEHYSRAVAGSLEQIVISSYPVKGGEGIQVGLVGQTDGIHSVARKMEERLRGDGDHRLELEKSTISDPIAWRTIPNLGRTLSGVQALPVTAPARTPGGNSTRLEYDVHLFQPGEVEIQVTLAPTMNFTGRGLRYAVSIDDERPQIVNVHVGADGRVMRSGESDPTWETWVANNANVQKTRHRIAQAGAHVVKVWLVDPGLVFERVAVVTGALPPSYLGPPESVRLTGQASIATTAP